jgi:hypothetical protein
VQHEAAERGDGQREQQRQRRRAGQLRDHAAPS